MGKVLQVLMWHSVEVILKTGELKELEDLKNDSDVIALRELRSVAWFALGAKQVTDVSFWNILLSFCWV